MRKIYLCNGFIIKLPVLNFVVDRIVSISEHQQLIWLNIQSLGNVKNNLK